MVHHVLFSVGEDMIGMSFWISEFGSEMLSQESVLSFTRLPEKYGRSDVNIVESWRVERCSSDEFGHLCSSEIDGVVCQKEERS